jgi:hypothetical protein
LTDYLACLADGSPPIRFHPPDPDPVPHPDARYFARALAALEGRALTVYLTWRLDALPSYGEDVVAVVLGDEPARIPGWAHRVAATFKAYGTRPSLGVRGPALASRLGVAAALELAEKAAIRAPGAVRARFRRRARIFPIPIGYFDQLDLPVTPILERPTDVFFAGSVAHFAGDAPLARRVIPSAKAVARREMLAALDRTSPDLRVELQLVTGFAAGAPGSLPADEYSRRLMASRVCLAPRGNSVETFRLFEGMRYGCVVVCDPQPRRWFYDGAPVVTVTRWRDLPRILDGLLSDEAGLRQRHEATLGWWRERCGEDALGAYMAARV